MGVVLGTVLYCMWGSPWLCLYLEGGVEDIGTGTASARSPAGSWSLYKKGVKMYMAGFGTSLENRTIFFCFKKIMGQGKMAKYLYCLI